MFLKLFDINENDLILCNEELISNDYDNLWMGRKNFNLPKNNVCISPEMICLLDDNINVEIFENNIFYFQKIILSNKKITNEKINDWVFFPRAKKENFRNNNYPDSFYENVYRLLKNKNHIIYNIEDTTDIIDQINIIRSAKNIILDYGSSFLVNGLFCENTNIYLTSKLQHTNEIGSRTIQNIIKNKNNIFYV